MNAVEFLKEKARMCNAQRCNINCLLSKKNNGKELLCNDFEKSYPEKAIEIVEKWAKENPVKTYLSVILELFPNAKINNGSPMFCPFHVFEIKSGCPKLLKDNSVKKCNDCWNREYKEESK